MFKFWFEKVVKQDERGFLYDDGALVRLLEPGRHSIFDPRSRLTCEVVKVMRADMPIERAQLFARTQPALAAECFEIVQCGPHEVAIVDFDGDPKNLVLPNTSRAYWKVITRVTVEKIDAAAALRVTSAISTGSTSRARPASSPASSRRTRRGCSRSTGSCASGCRRAGTPSGRSAAR